MTYEKLTQRQRIAAELYAYSLANYSDHLGNERFTRYMPENVDLLERAVKEGWDNERIAKELDMEIEGVPQLIDRLADAHKVIDAPNASESFRESVRQQLVELLRDKVTDEKELEKIVVQMCYCASDLGCLLEWEGKRLVDYSEWLRRTPDCDYTGIDLPNLASFVDDQED
jgi:hypothetical protein